MNTNTEQIWTLLGEVMDPELPVLSIVDLAIVRDVRESGGKIDIIITPTYTGCPAMDVIRMEINAALMKRGIKNFTITTTISPPWTTEWMSEAGKEKLKAFGIAPPQPGQSVCHPEFFQREEAIQCPHCDSFNTKIISRFGSTACKAQYQCNNCLEPFDYFKCH